MRTTTAGRDNGFTAYVAANTDRLLHLAELLTGSPHDAPDLVQSALIRVYPRWSRISSDDPTGYIRRVMINIRTDWWRRRRPPEVLVDVPVEVGGGADLAEEQAHYALVLGALATLTKRERQVIVLRYYCDLTEPVIAAEAGIAVGTVKSTLARALTKLRAMPEIDPAFTAPATRK